MSAAGLVRLAPVGLGLALGIVIVGTSAYRNAPLWPVWASLAIALTTAAGAVFVHGFDRWAELSTLLTSRTPTVRDVSAPVTAGVTIALLGVLASVVVTTPAWSSWRGAALVVLAIAGGVPAAGVMFGVQRGARDESVAGTRGERVALLIALRQLLQRLLAAVGSLVALATLALGAAVALQRSLPAGSGRLEATKLPPETVLIFGGAGSLLVALVYTPAATALQRRGRGLCDELFPLDKADEASVILSLAEDRHKLEQLLGVDRGVVADLQTGLAILGPLLASAAAAFLPR
jgi:hypothetical protein